MISWQVFVQWFIIIFFCNSIEVSRHTAGPDLHQNLHCEQWGQTEQRYSPDRMLIPRPPCPFWSFNVTPPFPPPSGCPSCNPNLREFHHAPLQSPHIRRDYGMLRIRFQIVFPLDKLQNNRCRNCLHWQPLQLQPQSCLQWSFSSGYFQKIFWNFGSFCQILILQ